MRAPLDLIGKRYGRLTVLVKNPVSSPSNNTRWDCVCDCGRVTTVIGSKLVNGHTSSCGCFHEEQFRASTLKHGMSSTPEYNIWCGIKDRCYNSRNEAYQRYGGRGITMCDRWRESFQNFYDDMGGKPSENHSIERLDNDKGYSSDNCVWATPTEQANNRRSNNYQEYNGVTKTVAEWSREYSMSYAKLSKRLKKGIDIHTAVTTL